MTILLYKFVLQAYKIPKIMLRILYEIPKILLRILHKTIILLFYLPSYVCETWLKGLSSMVAPEYEDDSLALFIWIISYGLFPFFMAGLITSCMTNNLDEDTFKFIWLGAELLTVGILPVIIGLFRKD